MTTKTVPAPVLTLEDMIAERGKTAEAMDAIVRTATQDGGRALNATEQAEYDGLAATFDSLDANITAEATKRAKAEFDQAHASRLSRSAPLLIHVAPKTVAAQRSLDELLWSTNEVVQAGAFDRNGRFVPNAYGAVVAIDPVVVLDRAGNMVEAPRLSEFAADQQALVRRFQTLVSRMMLFGLMVGTRGKTSSAEAWERAKSDPRFAGRWQSMLRAMDVDTAAEGTEWVPTGIGATLHEKVRAAGRVANLFASIDLPTNPWKWPIEGADAVAYRVAEPTSDTATKVTASTAGTAAATFDAEILGGRILFSRSLEADSALAILGYAEGKLAQAHADAVEKAIIDGDTDGTHMDSDIGASTTAAVTSWDGLRKRGLANNSTDGGNNALTATDLRTIRAAMGKYGVNPGNLAWILPLGPYFDLLDDDDFRTVDKYGPGATILNGELGKIDGIPVIISEHGREDLNASGVYDGVTTDRTFGLIVNRGEYALGRRMAMDVEADDSIYRETYQRVVVAFQRLDFQNISGAAGTDDVGIAYNVT